MLRVLLASAFLAACNLAQLSSPTVRPSDDAVRAFCRDARFDPKVQPTEDKVHDAMCGELRGKSIEVYADAAAAGTPGGLDAAILLVACVESGMCKLRAAKDWYDPYCVPGRGECNFSPSRAADVAVHAHDVTADRVRGELATTQIPPPVRARFLADVEESRKVLAESLGKLDLRRREIYVMTAERVHARRREDERALARFYERLATWKPQIDSALLDKRMTRAMLDETIQLRDSYVLACLERKRTAQYCLTGPVARPLVKLIARGAIALGDSALAEAENAVLAFGPSLENVEVEVHLAVQRAMDAETALHGEWKKAKDAGTDPSVLARKFGDPAPWNLRDETNQAGLRQDGIATFADEIRALPQAERIARPLRRVEVHGTRATLVFGEPGENKFGCERDLLADSRRACEGPWGGDEDGRVAPIDVPAFEASRLAPGNFVYAVAGGRGRTGHVVQAFGPDGVQYRAFRAFRDVTP